MAQRAVRRESGPQAARARKCPCRLAAGCTLGLHPRASCAVVAALRCKACDGAIGRWPAHRQPRLLQGRRRLASANGRWPRSDLGYGFWFVQRARASPIRPGPHVAPFPKAQWPLRIRSEGSGAARVPARCRATPSRAAAYRPWAGGVAASRSGPRAPCVRLGEKRPRLHCFPCGSNLLARSSGCERLWAVVELQVTNTRGGPGGSEQSKGLDWRRSLKFFCSDPHTRTHAHLHALFRP